MAKLSYTFDLPPPAYFRKHGWFQCDNTYKFVGWAFSRCSSETREIMFDGKKIILKPFQFIFGRRVCSNEINMSEDEVRTQQKSMENAGFLKKAPNSTPKRFTIYEWVLDAFSENDPQVTPQVTPKSPPSHPHKQDIVVPVVVYSDKKQQQQKEQEEKPVAVFSCLLEIPESFVPAIEKVRISKKYSESEVNQAVECVMSEGFTPQETYLKSLNAALKNKWEPKKKKQDIIQENKDYIKKIYKSISPSWKIEVLSKHVEFINGPVCHVFLYNQPVESFKKEIILKLGKKA